MPTTPETPADTTPNGLNTYEILDQFETAMTFPGLPQGVQNRLKRIMRATTGANAVAGALFADELAAAMKRDMDEGAGSFLSEGCRHGMMTGLRFLAEEAQTALEELNQHLHEVRK